MDVQQTNFQNFCALLSGQLIQHQGLTCAVSAISHPYFNAVLPSPNLELQSFSQLADFKKIFTSHHKKFYYWVKDAVEVDVAPAECLVNIHFDLVNYQPRDIVDQNYTVLLVADVEQLHYWIYPYLAYYRYKGSVCQKLFERYQAIFDRESALQHLVLFRQAKPVGSASLFIDNHVAGIYNVAVKAASNQATLLQYLKFSLLNLAKGNHCDQAVAMLPNQLYNTGLFAEFSAQQMVNAYLYR